MLKITPSGYQVARFQRKTVFNSQSESCLLCGISGVRSSSDTTTTPHGFDMILLWVPRGHVALASVVLEGTLTECGPIHEFCVTIVTLRISKINFYPRALSGGAGLGATGRPEFRKLLGVPNWSLRRRFVATSRNPGRRTHGCFKLSRLSLQLRS